MNSTKLEGMIETSLDSLKKIVDVNTVVGEAIKTESGTTVIPISKVSLGYVSGGTDFGGKKSDTPNFAGGGGSGVTVKPLGFLVIKANGSVEFLAAETKGGGGGPTTTVGSIVELIEKSPAIVEKFKKLFSKPKKAKDGKGEDDATADDGADETAEETVGETVGGTVTE